MKTKSKKELVAENVKLRSALDSATRVADGIHELFHSGIDTSDDWAKLKEVITVARKALK